MVCLLIYYIIYNILPYNYYLIQTHVGMWYEKNLMVLEEKVRNYVTVSQTFTYTITHNGPMAISFRKLSL